MSKNVLFPKQHRDALLSVARKSLEHYFHQHELFSLDTKSVPVELLANKATFVSLYLLDELRGCVGTLYPERPIYKDIIHNTFEAAFHDYRFDRLHLEELSDINIEISIISDLIRIKSDDSKKLLAEVSQLKPGVKVSSGVYSATFLPQVWKRFKDPNLFMTELCIKAGLAGNHWQNKKLDVDIYQTITFAENNFRLA